MDWIAVIRELGIMATACGFFIWTAWLREERLTKRLELLEQFVQTQLLAIIATQTKCIESCTDSLEASTKATERLTAATMTLETQTAGLFKRLQDRPCLLPGEWHPNRAAKEP